MYSVGARESSSHCSSSHRLQDRERASRCSDSWSSCGTSGRDSGYRDGRGRKADRHRLRTSPGPLWYPPPALYSALSPSSPSYTLFKHHWHSVAPVPALTGHKHSHTQRRSPSRGAAAVAAIPVHSWLSVYVYVCVRKAEGGWAGGWIWQRKGGGEGGGVRGRTQAAGESPESVSVGEDPLNLSSTGCIRWHGAVT